MLNGTAALLTVAKHLGWSIAVMAIDLLVIFGLWAYGLQRPAGRSRGGYAQPATSAPPS
jgi:hypothetical protein